MSSPPPKSLVPAPTTMPTVWPPSNPSGTVIPFPLPWGQTGCCPPGGMDALMKCYCDIQQASAFIGQIMLDQINNNPAIIQAIIAAIEASGSTLPLLGVTNGQPAQPGQVGEFIAAPFNFAFSSGTTTGTASVNVLQPGDWFIWVIASPTALVTSLAFNQQPVPAGMEAPVAGFTGITGGAAEAFDLMSTLGRGNFSVPTLMSFQISISASAAGTMEFNLFASRAR